MCWVKYLQTVKEYLPGSIVLGWAARLVEVGALKMGGRCGEGLRVEVSLPWAPLGGKTM